MRKSHAIPYCTEGPNKMNQKRPTPRHFVIKMAKFKDKQRILKAAR